MERSNWARLKGCIKKAEEGKELTIGFLGGSITQGSLATMPENTYAYQVFLWWKNTILLDGNFDEDWGDCLYLETVLHHGEKKKHTLEIRILPDTEKEAAPFYLMVLIVA